MKWDVLIIRLFFVVMLAAVGYLLNPLAQTTHLSSGFRERQWTSAVVGAFVALFIIAFEMRARMASLRTLIGAATGSILVIIGATDLDADQRSRHQQVPGEMRTFLTIVLAGFMSTRCGRCAKVISDLRPGGIFSDKNITRLNPCTSASSTAV